MRNHQTKAVKAQKDIERAIQTLQACAVEADEARSAHLQMVDYHSGRASEHAKDRDNYRRMSERVDAVLYKDL